MAIGAVGKVLISRLITSTARTCYLRLELLVFNAAFALSAVPILFKRWSICLLDVGAHRSTASFTPCVRVVSFISQLSGRRPFSLRGCLFTAYTGEGVTSADRRACVLAQNALVRLEPAIIRVRFRSSGLKAITWSDTTTTLSRPCLCHRRSIGDSRGFSGSYARNTPSRSGERVIKDHGKRGAAAAHLLSF